MAIHYRHYFHAFSALGRSDLGASALRHYEGCVDKAFFFVEHAATLITYAKQKKLGLVSFWAIQRDEKCPTGIDLNLCTGVNASALQFHQIFDSVNH